MTASSRSLFSRVNRFVPSGDTTPRENRLTEAFAAVLDRVDGLARTLAIAWLDTAPPRDPRERCSGSGVVRERLVMGSESVVHVATQVPCGGRYVDLELRFASIAGLSADDVRVWIEIKHGTHPHTGQLAAYRKTLGDMGDVVLLAPASSLPYPDSAEVPAAIPQRSWEQVGQLCARYDARSVVEGWLLDELVAYLREEGLMGIESLKPEHLTALAYAQQAEAALEVICDQAKAYVAQHWDGTFDNDEKLRHGITYSAWYTAPPGTHLGPNGAWLDWVVTRAAAVHPLPPDGAVFFMAGLSVDRGHEMASNDAQRAWQRALEDGVETDARRLAFRRWTGNHERLHTVAYPHEVLAGGSLEEQGAALGRWVIDSFRVICNPPVPYP